MYPEHNLLQSIFLGIGRNSKPLFMYCEHILLQSNCLVVVYGIGMGMNSKPLFMFPEHDLMQSICLGIEVLFMYPEHGLLQSAKYLNRDWEKF